MQTVAPDVKSKEQIWFDYAHCLCEENVSTWNVTDSTVYTVL